MHLHTLPVLSTKSDDILFEVHDGAGHCTIFEREELRNLSAPIGDKVIYDNYEITPEEELRLLREGRAAAAEYATKLRLL